MKKSKQWFIDAANEANLDVEDDLLDGEAMGEVGKIYIYIYISH